MDISHHAGTENHDHAGIDGWAITARDVGSSFFQYQPMHLL